MARHRRKRSHTRKNPRRVRAARRAYKRSGLYKYNQRKRRGKRRRHHGYRAYRRRRHHKRWRSVYGGRRRRRFDMRRRGRRSSLYNRSLTGHQRANIKRLRAMYAARAIPSAPAPLPLP